ncbi:hypothetical protein AB0C18_30865 [Nonomuraea muscovyensis]|uniref:hypothetical protein n=1 Tax=Nonomuraea muscovyensis TaxID=1124761 RepID=UPI0033FAB958|nr:hypothetical protein [Nonomuraea muscovyensis]
MWIRGTARPLVGLLLGIEISIIALAPAASAAPMAPDGEPRLTPRIITRSYHVEEPVQVSRWYVPQHRHVHSHAQQSGHVPQDGYVSGYRPGDGGRHRKVADRRARTATGTARAALPALNLGRVKHRHATVRMSHDHAAKYLLGAGLRYRSTGHCTDRHVNTCTSLDSVRTGTVARIIALKHASDCPIMVTGGTEVGHAPGRFSHGQGYKLDISHNACIDRYIAQHSEPAGVRGDGARLYRAPSGTVYADESDHWDIMFK